MNSNSSIALTNQWNDFLLRKFDTYALTKYDILLRALGDVTGYTTLVAGSGSGEFAVMLAKAGAKVLAIDIDKPSIDLTRQTAQDAGVSIETEVATIESQGSSMLFDLVAATDVLEHIEDDQFAASKLVSLLKPGGKIAITVPAMPSLFGYHDEILGHFRRYKPAQFRKLFSEKISIETFRYYGFTLIAPALLISKWLRRPYPVSAVSDSSEKTKLFAKVVRAVLSIEKVISPPVGISLIMVGSLTRNLVSKEASHL